MLNITKEWKGDTLVATIIGVFDDAVDLEHLIGLAPKQLELNSKGVTNITSHGVRHWISYFKSVQESGTRVKHVACSSAIVQQANLIKNFINDPNSIESICLPYLCSACKKQFVAVVATADLKSRKAGLPCLRCKQCGKDTAEFDDIETEYLGFLKRK